MEIWLTFFRQFEQEQYYVRVYAGVNCEHLSGVHMCIDKNTILVCMFPLPLQARLVC